MQRWIKKSSKYYYLELTHFTYKEIDWLKVKGLKKIFYLCLVPPNNLKFHKILCRSFTSGSVVKIYLQCKSGRRLRLDPWVGKIPLEKETATHSSILVWRIPWKEEPCGLQSIESQRVGHNWSDLAKIFVLVGREVKWHSQNLPSVFDY